MTAAKEALQKLVDGNRRYVNAQTEGPDRSGEPRRQEVATGQHPFAIVLGCADSRVPPEIVFDQGLGDLFTVRVAGNIAGLSQIGSIEFAVEQFGCRLVVVLGHSGCGAVQAALGIRDSDPAADGVSPGLVDILDHVVPAVRPHIDDPENVRMHHAIQANVNATLQRLQDDSEVLTRYAKDEGLQMIGAQYDLASGCVEFLEPQS